MLSKERAISCFIIAASYVGARACCGSYVNSGAVLNPAIGFGADIISYPDGIKWIWVFSCMPFGGSILALIFHELIFKKTQEVLNEDEHEDPDTLLDK